MRSFALEIFQRCMEQVEEIESVAQRRDTNGGVASILRRSAYVLAVAALDSYCHERGADLLNAYAQQGRAEAVSVANYIGNASATDVAGPHGSSHVRLRLSFKTLVAPTAIDRLLDAAGLDSQSCWLQTAFSLSTRPDRLRRQLELVYDRRNLIAHEADWDMVQLDFRNMEQAHLKDCSTCVTAIAETLDMVL